MEEPSLLDYLKSKLNPWSKTKIELPAEDKPLPVPEESGINLQIDQLEPEPEAMPQNHWPWRMLASLLLALVAQRLLEPPDRSIQTALILYTISAGLMIWALLVRELHPVELSPEADQPLYMKARWPALVGMTLFMLAAFIAFSGNEFNILNLVLWGIAFIYTFMSFWERTDQPSNSLLNRLKGFSRPAWNLHLTRWAILLIAAAAVVIFYRFFRLNQVPGEMFSDHAEKLLDVSDVISGKYSIFFPRNTGREFIQFYLTALIASVTGLGLSFLSLKLGTALCGLLTLPYIYKLGKEIGNRWVGLFAFLLAGIAYWPNVISRIGLRFPLYPLFAAPALYYLIRGIRQSRRNDFIWSGIFLGFGLHGYSPARILPIVLVILVLIYLAHRQSQGKRSEALVNLIILALVSLVAFLPLARYATENPEMFSYRALTRLSSTESALPGSAVGIFINNLWKAWIMPFYDNGQIWVHSIPGRPALDVVCAALFFLGTILVIARYIRQRNWVDLALILSVPLLMLPSILSLAFPDENPSLNRTGAAIVPVFITIGIALEAILRSLRERLPRGGRWAASLVALCLLFWSFTQNYSLVFNQFDKQFMAGAWNTSEMGQLIRNFADSVGSEDSAYVVPYPYWVDTRLVGINAGYPLKDYALWPENFSKTLAETRAKLFILNPKDESSLVLLKQMYPQHTIWYYKAKIEGKDFYVFFVPPASALKTSQ